MTKTSSKRTRYRVENGKVCIDMRVKEARQLFDGRDPAPFRERDLDDDAVDYLLASLREIPAKEALKIVVTISEAPEPRLTPEVIIETILEHFRHERVQIERRIREHLHRGQIILLVGLVVLVVFLSLARMAQSLPDGHLREIVSEGLVIFGWVAMWRPIEVLLYDWWPHVDQRKQVDRVLAAEITVRYLADARFGNDR